MRLALLVILSIARVLDAAGVDCIGMTVSDLDRSVEFYSKILHFEKIAEHEAAGEAYEHLEGVFGLRMRIARLRLGDESIELTEFLAPKGRPIPADARSNDFSFQHLAIIVSDMDKAYAWLRQNRVRHASPGPQRLPDSNPVAGGIRAFYFRDPDGHFLEILEFPPGKGKAKWHKADGGLFLGIDHTAIVVKDTEVSLYFYRDMLRMKIVGESENYGEEQERLNNVFGARLRITSLGRDEGPGVEFLEYLSPGGGRPYPRDEEANDLIHWQTRFSGIAIEEAAREFRQANVEFISSGITNVPNSEMGFQRAVMVRDPDGHAVQLTER